MARRGGRKGNIRHGRTGNTMYANAGTEDRSRVEIVGFRATLRPRQRQRAVRRGLLARVFLCSENARSWARVAGRRDGAACLLTLARFGCRSFNAPTAPRHF